MSDPQWEAHVKQFKKRWGITELTRQVPRGDPEVMTYQKMDTYPEPDCGTGRYIEESIAREKVRLYAKTQNPLCYACQQDLFKDGMISIRQNGYCGHVFHARCLIKDSCPVCDRSLRRNV